MRVTVPERCAEVDSSQSCNRDPVHHYCFSRVLMADRSLMRVESLLYEFRVLRLETGKRHAHAYARLAVNHEAFGGDAMATAQGETNYNGRSHRQRRKRVDENSPKVDIRHTR